jgi:hypothetical protein
VGDGDNDVALTQDGQAVLFGTGSDRLRLGGRSAGDLIDVEVIDASGGGSIAQAIVDAGSGQGLAAGSLGSGVKIDFGNGGTVSAPVHLGLTASQHETLRAVGAVPLEGVGSGYQGLVLDDALVNLSEAQMVAALLADLPIKTVTALDGIERYVLGAYSGAGDGLRIRAGGVDANTNLGGASTPLLAVNDLAQGGLQLSSSTRQMVGSSDNDSLRTSGIDAFRGQLIVDLSTGGNDLVFVGNAVWGNPQGGQNGGLGGLVFDHGSGIFANASTLTDTIALWPGLTSGAGTQAVTINGFTTSGLGIDRLAMTNDAGTPVQTPLFAEITDLTTLPNNIRDFTSVEGTVLEFAVTVMPTGGGAITDPRQLDQVARLLAGMSRVDDGSYYLIFYSDSTPLADAWLYAAVATAGDGFDFVNSGGANANPLDRDTLELIGIFTDVGANNFSAANLAGFSAPPTLIVLPPDPGLLLV